MKQLLFLSVHIVLFITAKAQSISPSETQEYCPGTEYTFTVNILKTYLSMNAFGGAAITLLPQAPVGSTFTFKGQFADVNVKQTFRIYYSDNTYTDFDFKRIKSLFHGACTSIQPNQLTVTAPRCQVSNFSINFSNVQWKTQFENPALCFGSITTYEYQLPNGWSIGNNSSNGSNWIQGNNSVVVTSDQSNGDGGYIRIRPVNSCGSGLKAGEATSIYVSRPAPTLAITPFAQTICTGSANYTLTGAPAGSTISWAVSNPTQASVAASPGNPNVAVVTRTGTADTRLTLTATVTNCNFTYQATASVVLGSPAPEDIVGTEPSVHFSAGQYVTLSIAEGGSNYNWYITGGTIVGSNTGQSVYVKLDNCSPSQTAWNQLYASVSYQNACGTSQATGEPAYAECDGNDTGEGDHLMRLSPNPAKDYLTVSFIDEPEYSRNLPANTSIRMELFQFNTGVKKKQWQFTNAQKQFRLDLTGVPKGIYLMKVTKGKYHQSVRVIVE